VGVAHVADEEPQARLVAEVLPHLELLELVPAIDDHPPDLGPLEDRAHETATGRTGAAGDQDGSSVEDAHQVEGPFPPVVDRVRRHYPATDAPCLSRACALACSRDLPPRMRRPRLSV